MLKLGLLLGSGYIGCSAILNKQKRADYRGFFSSSYNSVQAAWVLSVSVVDYMYGLKGLSPGTDEYHDKRSEIHHRVAQRMLKLSLMSRGVYFKAGQYIGNLERIMPKEYTDVLSVLQDNAPQLPWAQIKVVLDYDLPGYQDEFEYIAEDSIGAASLAQVHQARLKTGEEVAVKLQYPFLYVQSLTDFYVLKCIVKTCNWMLRLNDYQEIELLKLWEVFKEMYNKEIDFNNERLNAEATRRLFKGDPKVSVPRIHRKLSGTRVITMEFMHGVKISNIEGVVKLGFSKKEIASLLIEIFSRMIFVEGHVHCDPHPGNILVRNNNGKPQLILLDHGFYKTLSKDFRLMFCKLWESLVTFDYRTVREISDELGLGEYYKFLPLVFLYRTVNSVKPLGETLTKAEGRELHAKNELSFNKISVLMQLLPPELMFVIRTSNLIAIHNFRLGGSTRDRLIQYTNVAFSSLYTSFLSYYWHRFMFSLWNLIYYFFPSLIQKMISVE